MWIRRLRCTVSCVIRECVFTCPRGLISRLLSPFRIQRAPISAGFWGWSVPSLFRLAVSGPNRCRSFPCVQRARCVCSMEFTCLRRVKVHLVWVPIEFRRRSLSFRVPRIFMGEFPLGS